MKIDIPLTFRTPEQKEFFELKERNTCFSGGFGNGKTWVGCQKALFLSTVFPKSRGAIVRYEESKLRETTMKTFFSICPPTLYDTNYGGNRADSQNKLRLINDTEILWMHLKDADEGMVRGLEVNWILIDQAEETSESMYRYLSPRAGRWSQGIVPNELLAKYPNWPIAQNTRHPLVPSYVMALCNPDSELHWIYRRFHPDSELFQSKYKGRYRMVQGATTVATISQENLGEMLENDEDWVQRFVYGKWGIPGGQIHTLSPESVLEIGVNISEEFWQFILARSVLIRILDHGDAAPTVCLWFACWNNYYFCYREYYQPNRLISDHRIAIAELSTGEKYLRNLADPQIFKKTMQKYGGQWTVAEEYLDSRVEGPPIAWQPADNNEFGTRNRLSELLKVSEIKHPVTGVIGSPRMFFIKRNANYPNGCAHVISETRSQKREKIGTLDGRDLYSEDRAKMSDHAYDCLRYFVASHVGSAAPIKPQLPAGSFGWFKKQMSYMKKGWPNDIQPTHLWE
jgi:hypothetical protein